jgi:hypothetical protein
MSNKTVQDKGFALLKFGFSLCCKLQLLFNDMTASVLYRISQLVTHFCNGKKAPNTARHARRGNPPTKGDSAGDQCRFKGKTKPGDPDKMRRNVALHGDSSRVKKNRHISEAQRRRACANFSKQQAQKLAEQKEKGKAEKSSGFAKEIEETIEWWKEPIKSGEKYNCASQREIRMKKFMDHSWKKLNYTAMFDRAVLDCERYAREFVSRSELC